MSTPQRIIIHHSDDPQIGPQLAKIDEWHKFLGFPKSSLGYFVGYTYLIEESGKVVQTRKDDEVQAHTKGMNDGSIGICLAGNLDIQEPTSAQRISLQKLVDQKFREYALLPANIAGHRAWVSTTCPGKYLSDAEIKSTFNPDLSYLQILLIKLTESIRTMRLKVRGIFGGKVGVEDNI